MRRVYCFDGARWLGKQAGQASDENIELEGRLKAGHSGHVKKLISSNQGLNLR